MNKLRFPDMWANLQYGFNTLKIICMLLAVITIGSLTLLGIKIREKPYIERMIAGKPEAVEIEVLKITPEWINNFTSFFMTEFGSWGYNNYKTRLENIKSYMSAEVFAKQNENFKTTEQVIIDNKLLNTFEIVGIEIVSAGDPYIVEINGKNTVTGDKINEAGENIKYRLQIEKVKFSAKNPWGLELKDIREVKQ